MARKNCFVVQTIHQTEVRFTVVYTSASIFEYLNDIMISGFVDVAPTLTTDTSHKIREMYRDLAKQYPVDGYIELHPYHHAVVCNFPVWSPKHQSLWIYNGGDSAECIIDYSNIDVVD